ncbi:PilZ domain-containing protein [Desulfocurvus sp.]|jgi:hypothetical protein|uniref:PilZ domain-containing protein n=1 Tax=Desulfocurvus sp. TaxID=2871698 RepID=UPI0025C549D5|nr:PilZ domain-containing protein [Desulfocurvus sp.]MCK9241178.1 PilZ domain-containing protein [Desulfocurvus sp.]
MSEHHSRSRSRVPARFEAIVSWQGLTVPVVSENLSLRGMLCAAPHGLGMRTGEACVVRLTLGAGTVLSMGARVARAGRGTLALAFEEMDPATFAHLRNVVRYAACDPDAIDAELGAGG